MEIAWQRVLPVIVSIVIIIAVAILREYSKTFAAVAATMPINIPLALWIVSAGSTRQEMQEFTHAVFLNIWPTIVFIIVTWLAARAGWGVGAMIIAGYIGWGVSLGVMLLVRQVLGI
jgi:positive regulator of sigma E activity